MISGWKIYNRKSAKYQPLYTIRNNPKLKENMTLRLLLLFSLLIPHVGFGQDDKDVLSIAILRNDGILTPVQRYENKEWINIKNKFQNWTNEYKEEWIFYSMANEKSIIKTGDYVHINFDADYDDYGFITDFQHVKLHESYERKTVAGVALSKDVPLQIAKRVVKLSPDWNSIKLILKDFPNTIDTTDNRIKRYTENHNLGKSLELELTKVWLFKMQGREFFFFSSLTKLKETGCPTLIRTQGLVFKNNQSYFLDEYDLSVGDCDGKFLSKSLTPIALFTNKLNSFLLFEAIPYEGVDYLIGNVREIKKFFNSIN